MPFWMGWQQQMVRLAVPRRPGMRVVSVPVQVLSHRPLIQDGTVSSKELLNDLPRDVIGPMGLQSYVVSCKQARGLLQCYGWFDQGQRILTLVTPPWR